MSSPVRSPNIDELRHLQAETILTHRQKHRTTTQHEPAFGELNLPPLSRSRGCACDFEGKHNCDDPTSEIPTSGHLFVAVMAVEGGLQTRQMQNAKRKFGHSFRPRTCRWRDKEPNERKRRVRGEIGEEHEEAEEEHEDKEDDARCPRRGELEVEETALMEATWHIKTIPATTYPALRM